MVMDTDLDDAVNDIISQLKGTASVVKREPEEVPLTKDQLEEFIIKNSGKLVTKSLTTNAFIINYHCLI